MIVAGAIGLSVGCVERSADLSGGTESPDASGKSDEPGPDGGNEPGERRRIFHLVNGTLGKIRDSADPRPGLEVADASCNEAAASDGLGGHWKAWLSDSTVGAIDRIADAGPWYRLDRTTKLFDDRAALAAGPLVPIKDEPERTLFWSGTLPDGTASPYLCADWTEYLGVLGTVGRTDVAGSAWSDADPIDCGNYLALLCIEQ